MRRMKRILLALLAVIVVALVGGYAYMMLAFPNVGDAPDISVAITPERVARGKYLAENVSMCIDCHSKRDYSRFAAPVVPGTEGMGGERFDEKMGLPGTFTSSNITPAGLREWTDGELYRAITSGVSRDGRVLFPIMPYPNFGKMDKEDIYSIIAYLRTLPAIEHEVPKGEANFPMSLIMRTIPASAAHETRPLPTDRVAYGKYLVNAAACAECHTPMEKGAPVPGKEFAGGSAFELPNGTLRTANLTPDRETGIGAWTEDMFVQRFKAYADSAAHEVSVPEGGFNTVMPWLFYSRMTDEDLRAIYAYLRTRKPVSNRVIPFTPRQ
ncbi:MAG TPA: cytochrome c [Bacteroidota bacterium]|nr:cytochrome c [Bacteroidota bacterium]